MRSRAEAFTNRRFLARGPGERREDRLDAQALELEEEVSLARHGEQFVGHLELVARRPADERLVAEDLARGHADDRLEDRAQPFRGENGLEPLDERLLLTALAGVGEPRRLGERAHDLPRRPHARVVRNHERGRVNVHEVDRGPPERLLQAAPDALAQARGLRLQRDAAPPGGAPRDVEKKEDAVGAVEGHREEARGERRSRDVLAKARGRHAQDPVVELPSVEALDAREAPELNVDDSEVRDALSLEIGERVQGQARDGVVEQRLETQPLDLGHLDRRSLGDELQGIRARHFRHDAPFLGPDAVRARTRARSSSARNGFVR